MAELMLVVLLVAMPLAPEPYRTMSSAMFRSSVPLGMVAFLGFRADSGPPGPMSAPPAVPPPTKRTIP